MAGGTTTLQIKLTTDGQGNVTAALDTVKQKLEEIKPAAEQGASAFDRLISTIETVKGMMLSWGVYEAVKEAVTAFIEANAEAQRLQATLIGVTGSAAAAAQAYGAIQAVAESSISSSQQLVDAWVRLANVGIAPTQDMMQSLANVANETGQSVDSVANAIAMAMQGHYRGLQQMGIQAEAVGDSLIVSFQGSSQIIDKSKESLAAYIETLGKTPAAIAAQDAQVKSLGGSWDQLKKHMSDYFEATDDTARLNTALQAATKLVDKYKELAAQGSVRGNAGFIVANPLLSMALAAASAASPDTKKTDAAEESSRKFTDTLDQQIAALTGVGNALTRVQSFLGGFATGFNNARAQVEQAKEEQLRNNDSLDKLTNGLHNQVTALGQSHEAMVRNAIATQQGAVADIAHQQAAIAAARALDQKTAALKAAAEFEAKYKAETSIIANLQQQVDLFGASADIITLYKASVEAAAAVDATHAQAIRDKSAALADLQRHQADVTGIQNEIKAEQQVSDAYDQVLASVDKVAAANLQYQKSVNVVEDAVKHGIISEQQAIDVEKKLAQARDDSISGNKQYEQSLHQLFDQMDSDAASLFADMFVNGTQDAGQKMMEEMRNLAKQLSEFWIKQKIIIPFEQKMEGTGDGPKNSDIAMGLVGMGGMAIGGAVGGKTGGFISGAVGGAMSMAATGNPYAIIAGAIIGGIMGALGSASNKTPSFQIGGAGTGDPNALNGGQFTDYLGTFGLRGKHITDDMQRQLEGSIASFDNMLAGLIPPDLVDAVKTRIQSVNTAFTGASPDDVQKTHLDAVMGVVAPELQRFVDGLTSVQDRLKAFTALLGIKDEFNALASSIVQLSGSPVEKVADQMKQLDKAVTDAQGKLDAAIKTQDPTEILSAEQTLKQAILNRYQNEIQMVQQLQQALDSLKQQAYSLNMDLANKIAALGGDASGPGNVALAGLQDTQAQIQASTDAQTTLNLLQQFTSQVDQWLNAAIASINAPLEAQIAQLESQKAQYQAQYQAQVDYATALAQAQQANRQAEIAALQKQLQLAQQWLGVLQQAQQAVQSLTTGNANPLGGFSQADNLEAIISQLTAKVNGETGSQQATDAATLIQDLQQRLQLIQSGNLYDRSSPEYMAAYNQTLQQLNAIEALAGPEASQVDLLEKQIAALQSVQQTIIQVGGEASYALAGIDAQEAALRAQEKENADKLQKQALDYYTWAQGVAADAEQKRHDELMAQLNQITGGLSVNDFIAQETSKEVDLLQSIDDQLKAFLTSISSGGAAGSGSGTGTGGTGGNGPGTGNFGGGGSGGGISPIIGQGGNIVVNVHTTVNGTGMGSQDIAAAVNAGLNDALPAAVPALKRMLKRA